MDSLLGIKGDGFVLIAADASAGRSILVFKTDQDKIMELDSHKLLASAVSKRRVLHGLLSVGLGGGPGGDGRRLHADVDLDVVMACLLGRSVGVDWAGRSVPPLICCVRIVTRLPHRPIHRPPTTPGPQRGLLAADGVCPEEHGALRGQ